LVVNNKSTTDRDPPKVRIQPQAFSGNLNEDVVRYVEKFDRIAKAIYWTDADSLKILPRYLSGAAADWYNLWARERDDPPNT
jgi:hypothetical protein